MKYMLPLILVVLTSCTNPEFVVLKDKTGNPIHTTQKDTFFNSPDKTSEWLFWYTPIFLGAGWLMWREIKSIRFGKKKEEVKNP
jgi:hypothetical protein